jgi:hypothetical protein
LEFTKIKPNSFSREHRDKVRKCLFVFGAELLSSSVVSKNLNIKIYRIIILPVVVYGYETWSLVLREELRLRASENRVLRKLAGPKTDEVIGKWTKLHKE